MWDIREGVILHRLSGGGQPVDAVCWLGDDIVAASGAAGSVHIWDLAEVPADDSAIRSPTGSLPEHEGAPGPAVLQQTWLSCPACHVTQSNARAALPPIKLHFQLTDHVDGAAGRSKRSDSWAYFHAASFLAWQATA